MHTPLFIVQCVIAQPLLQVQLFSYKNPLNLETRSNEPAGPFCCCNMEGPCFPSIQNFSSKDCGPPCGLRFSICVQNPASGEESCRVSATKLSPSFIDFTTVAPLFPDEPSPFLVNLFLDESFASVSMYDVCMYMYIHVYTQNIFTYRC